MIQYKIDTTFESLSETFPTSAYHVSSCENTKTCERFKFFLISSVIFVNVLLILPTIFIDLKLLLYIRKSNKIQKNKNEGTKKESKLKKLLIFNSLFFIILRAPEITVVFLYFKYTYNIDEKLYNQLCLHSNYDCFKLYSLADFTFNFNSLLQFVLLYFFNRNFKESYHDLFNKKLLNDRNKK